MSTAISVASIGFDAANAASGQSFTPEVAGPDGSGSVGSATTAVLESITIGYPTAPSSMNSTEAYLYESLLSDPTAACEETAIAASTGYSDGSAFGPGTHTRTFTFEKLLEVGKTYYFYLPNQDSVQYLTVSTYSGGGAIDADGDLADFCLRFLADLTV